MGVNVPRGIAVSKVEDVTPAAMELTNNDGESEVVIKAQVYSLNTRLVSTSDG